MLPSRISALGKIDNSIEIKPESEKPKAEIWSMTGGRITQVMYDGKIICVKNSAPKDIDIIELITLFFDVCDISRSNVVNNVISSEKPKYERTHLYKNGTKINEGEEPIGKENTMNIYKRRIIELYKKYPESFTTKQLHEFFFDAYYPTLTKGTIKNLPYAYIGYMTKNNMIESVSYGGKRSSMHRFLKPPFEEELPVQAEFDPEIAKEQMAQALTTMTETDGFCRI